MNRIQIDKINAAAAKVAADELMKLVHEREWNGNHQVAMITIRFEGYGEMPTLYIAEINGPGDFINLRVVVEQIENINTQSPLS